MHMSRIVLAVSLPLMVLASPINKEARALSGLGGLGGMVGGLTSTVGSVTGSLGGGGVTGAVGGGTGTVGSVLGGGNPLPGTVGASPQPPVNNYYPSSGPVSPPNLPPVLPPKLLEDGEDGYNKRGLLGDVNAGNLLGKGVPVTIPIEVSNSGGIANGIGKGGIITNDGGILNSKEGVANNLLASLKNLDLGGILAR